MGDNLTAEQKRRIEENKQRAILLLETKKKNQQNLQPRPPQAPLNNSNYQQQQQQRPVFQNNQQQRPAANQNNQQQQRPQLASIFNPQPRPAAPVPAQNFYKQPNQNFSANNNNAKSSYNNSKQQVNKQSVNNSVPVRTISGVCSMISLDRFIVNIGYSKHYYDFIHEFKGASYNPTTKLWSVPISEHDNFIRSIDKLKPHVTVGPIPQSIINVFKNASKAISEENVRSYDFDEIDQTLVKSLLPFQRTGVEFGLKRNGRLLLADDMGLGKTIQALGIANYYKNEWPLLIVTPSSMRYPWREAIWNWLPSVPPESVIIAENPNDFISLSKIVILSYDNLVKRAESVKFKVVIFDESHNLKNDKTKRTIAAVPIIQNARRAILLSGTPALSKPIELYSQISSLCPRIFYNKMEYGIRYCNGHKTEQWGWDYNGSTNMDELQLLLKETIMIRRLKSEVLTQLTIKKREMVILEPKLLTTKSADIQSTAKEFKDAKGNERHGKMLRYYSETAAIKVNAVLNYVRDLVQDGKKFLCFAHHRVMLDAISDFLDDNKCKYIRIDGATPSCERSTLVDKFQTNDKYLVAVLSITAANTGITLTSASLVVFAELFWNPGILTQAEDRAHRIGQMETVCVQYLVGKGTVDDFLWPLLQKKLDVLNQAGLSKDNFQEAGTNSTKQVGARTIYTGGDGTGTQTSITDYYDISDIELDNLMNSLDNELLKNANASTSASTSNDGKASVAAAVVPVIDLDDDDDDFLAMAADLTEEEMPSPVKRSKM